MKKLLACVLAGVFTVSALSLAQSIPPRTTVGGGGGEATSIADGDHAYTGSLHITGEDSAADAGILLEGTGYNANLTFRRTEYLNDAGYPYFRIGDIQLGGVNLPMLMFTAGSTIHDERPVFILEQSGTVASVSDGTRRSHWEAFLNDGDVVPVMRLSSSPGMVLEMGPGGCEVAIGNLSRTSNVTTATCTTPHELQVGDSFYMSHSETNFPAFTGTPKTVASTPTIYQITYSDTGADDTSDEVAHYISGVTDVHWKRTGPSVAALALGGTERITFRTGSVRVEDNVDLVAGYDATNPLFHAVFSSSRVGMGTSDPSGKLHVEGTTNTEIVHVVQGASGQVNDLTQWIDSSDTELVAIDQNGAFEGVSLQASENEITVASGTGIAIGSNGVLKNGCYTVTVTYTAFGTGASTTGDKVIATLPAKARITSIISDTRFNYWATDASAIDLRIGTTTGGQELIVDHDVRNGAVTAGLADADLGTSINRANAVQGGHMPSWSTTTDISARITITGDDLDGMTGGQTDVYICVQHH